MRLPGAGRVPVRRRGGVDVRPAARRVSERAHPAGRRRLPGAGDPHRRPLMDKARGRIVIVGAGLAGLRAAETLRDEGFTGSLTVVGEERHQPYDRPPLSKQVLTGFAAPDHTALPRLRPLDDVHWELASPRNTPTAMPTACGWPA